MTYLTCNIVKLCYIIRLEQSTFNMLNLKIDMFIERDATDIELDTMIKKIYQYIIDVAMKQKVHWSIRYPLFVGILILLVLYFTINGSAKTISVDDDGGADYIKIQDAIDNATGDDTIRVHEGIYTESIEINNSIKLIGN